MDHSSSKNFIQHVNPAAQVEMLLLPAFKEAALAETWVFGYRMPCGFQGCGFRVSFMLAASTNNNRMDSYSYDAAGNLRNDGVHTYFYDAENHIVQVDGGWRGRPRRAAHTCDSEEPSWVAYPLRFLQRVGRSFLLI